MAERRHNSELHDAVSLVFDEFTELVSQRPALAEAVRKIANHLAETAPSEHPETISLPETQTDSALATGVEGPATATARLAISTRPEISSVSSEDDEKPRYSDVTDDDLSLMVQRCRLKAEGTLWALEREERLRDGADFHDEIRPNDQDIIQRAKKLPNCFLWMNQPRDNIWTRAGDYDLIADCFDALGESLSALDLSLDMGSPELFMEAIHLAAEAQSALRTAVSKVESYPDSDQQMAYHWLRNRANQDRFYIARFMKISDPADPTRCEAVIAEAQALQKLLKGSAEGEHPQEQRDVA